MSAHAPRSASRTRPIGATPLPEDSRLTGRLGGRLLLEVLTRQPAAVRPARRLEEVAQSDPDHRLRITRRGRECVDLRVCERRAVTGHDQIQCSGLTRMETDAWVSRLTLGLMYRRDLVLGASTEYFVDCMLSAARIDVT